MIYRALTLKNGDYIIRNERDGGITDLEFENGVRIVHVAESINSLIILMAQDPHRCYTRILDERDWKAVIVGEGRY